MHAFDSFLSVILKFRLSAIAFDKNFSLGNDIL